MSEIQLTRKSYVEIINQDIDWLMKNTTPSLERDHIIKVLQDSVNTYYEEPDETPLNENKKVIICIDQGHGTGL